MSRHQCLKELKCLLYVQDFKFLVSACQLARLPFRMSCQRNAKFQFHNALKKIENPEGHLILLGKWVLSDDIESLFYRKFCSSLAEVVEYQPVRGGGGGCWEYRPVLPSSRLDTTQAGSFLCHLQTIRLSDHLWQWRSKMSILNSYSP